MGSKQAPPPQDFSGAAQKQADSSMANVAAQTQANRPDVNGAFVNQSWQKDGNGNWTVNQGLANGLGDVQGALTQGALGAAQSPLGDGSDARNQAINATYGAATSRLDPQWGQRQEQLNTDLANQGLDPNSAAYRNAEHDFGNQRTDAYNQAMNSAISNGNQAQALTFNQNLAARNNPLQQLAQLASLTGTGPQFNAAGAADPLQALSAAQFQNQADLGQWQAQNQATSDAWTGGLNAFTGLAKAAIPFAL